MKDSNPILTLHETEELCRSYLQCQLSLLEEKELQYVLERLPYDSTIIRQAKESMIAEGLISRNNRVRRKPKTRWLGWSIGIAASLAILFSVFNHDGESGKYGTANHYLGSGTVIAYVNGKQLGPEASEKSVRNAIEQAERLMAMANAKEREEERKQQNIMNITSD